MIWIIVLLVFLLLSSWSIFFIHGLNKPDGYLVVDEAADSWTVSITTDPEEIKTKYMVCLKVEIKREKM